LTGTAVTGVIQSSTVMAVMVIGFVNSGLLNLEQAIGLIMGANIGTTLTTIFIALPIGKLGLPMLGLAALAYLFATNEKFRHSTKVIMGFGMIFFGLELIIAGFTPVRSVPELMHMLSLLSGHTLLGILSGY
jgi:phosphate:Na+ symporter